MIEPDHRAELERFYPTPAGAAPRDEARAQERNLKYLWRAFLRKLGVVNPESAAVLAHEDAADLFASFATEWLAAAPRADRNEAREAFIRYYAPPSSDALREPWLADLDALLAAARAPGRAE